MFLFKYFLFFMIYSFLGYIVEVIYVFLHEKKLINRGFLYGPYLPIYGFSSLFITVVLSKYKENIIVLFIASVISSFIIEYLTSFILEKIFNDYWWDYKKEKYNINGRVCIKALLLFGLLSICVVYFINGVLTSFINKLNNKKILLISIILLTIYIIDSITSIFILKKIKTIDYKYDKDIVKNNKRIFNNINNKKEKYKRV